VSAVADPRGSVVNRPTAIQAHGGEESEEESSQEAVSIELVANLSLELRGVTTIPQNLWLTIQSALQEHTTSVVSTILPALHFSSEIELMSVQENDGAPNRKKRSLRPDNTDFSVTLIYNELVQFKHIPGTEDLKAQRLAGLAFHAAQDREAFVELLHKKFDVLESLVSVSELSQSPTSLPVEAPTEIPKPTEASNNSNSKVLWTYGEDAEHAMSANDALSDREPRGAPIALIVIGVGLLCGTMFVLWRWRKL